MAKWNNSPSECLFYTFRNGDSYAGEYFADKMHGFGVYRFANGHRYEGAWHEGRRQGLGMYIFRNGETQAGHWQNGTLDILSTQNLLHGSQVAANHSKVRNAVQEAQRAAERAIDLPSFDDMANKTIAAANKAASAARVAAVKAVQKQIPSNGGELLVPFCLKHP
ncbi:MORN repeat-containing protein 4-like [Phalaenopsis equestris]|uniref:MORN repeat-containing protein 4-like n=1 Tax=Phalaenopsis equestris TaxID=78828 RepID=UPI0009E54730|nr:MORN repeat-containing protein 4-like [Phalaenopsis equestris]